mmetsp:Transcript_2231/g.6301  ORF Transcript_2231/g.6301 Transcript_2231/m.6301 type:complete len:313 (-) Transcript_2231:741-1679(-)
MPPATAPTRPATAPTPPTSTAHGSWALCGSTAPKPWGFPTAPTSQLTAWRARSACTRRRWGTTTASSALMCTPCSPPPPLGAPRWTIASARTRVWSRWAVARRRSASARLARSSTLRQVPASRARLAPSRTPPRWTCALRARITTSTSPPSSRDPPCWTSACATRASSSAWLRRTTTCRASAARGTSTWPTPSTASSRPRAPTKTHSGTSPRYRARTSTSTSPPMGRAPLARRRACASTPPSAWWARALPRPACVPLGSATAPRVGRAAPAHWAPTSPSSPSTRARRAPTRTHISLPSRRAPWTWAPACATT